VRKEGKGALRRGIYSKVNFKVVFNDFDARCRRVVVREEGRTSFLKKRSKKILFLGATRTGPGRWAIQQVQARGEIMLRKQSVSLADARRLIEAAEAKALEIGSPSNIAVADAGGHLVVHVRMDGAWMGSINISINKAFTARMFDIATKDLAEMAQPGKPFFGIHVSNHERVVIFAGGIPLKVGDEIVGAVGVSCGDGEQDQTVAEAAVRAL
jgi:uncharacterized protein GlcG (DUF336 family)